MSEEFLDRLARTLQHNILSDPADCWPYGSDNSRLHRPAMAVVFPATEKEVAAVVRLCRLYRVPLSARGRGTASTGGSIPLANGVVVSFERLKDLVDFDPAASTSGASRYRQPHRQDAALNMACSGADPAARLLHCRGNLACNAAPKRQYGGCRENTLGMRAVNGCGRRVGGAQTTKTLLELI